MEKVANSEEVFGKEVGLIHKVIVTGRKVGAGKMFWTILADNENVFRKVVKLVTRPAGGEYRVVVDYGRSLTEMIDVGKYDVVDSEINVDNFPVKGKGKHQLNITLFRFFDFDEDMDSEDIIATMKKRGYRPATIEELLALGEGYPDLQTKFMIVALGSVYQGTRLCVPLLRAYISEHAPMLPERFLDLATFYKSYGWSDKCRFAAVPK